MEHPFLETSFPIRWSALTPDRIETDIPRAIAGAERAVAAIAERAAEPPERLSYESTVGALEEALEPLELAWGKVSHLDSVCNSPELREAYNRMLPKVSAFFADVPLNAELWQTLKTFGESARAKELEAVRRRHVRETLHDFREQGADLPPEQKERARSIHNRLAEITQRFSENVLDATNAWEKVVTDRKHLRGLPSSAIEAARENAKEKGHGSKEQPAWRFTLHAPSLLPLLTYADNGELRREAWEALQAVGREAPRDNRPLVREILQLRQELAELLGKPHFADVVTERRMVGSGKAALDFTEDLHVRVRDAFAAEQEALREFRAAHTGGRPSALAPWEAAYWAEKQRQERYEFDEEELRPYFPIDRVLSGLFDLTERIFRLRIRERETICPGNDSTDADGNGGNEERPEVWHPEVRFYDLLDADGRHLGSFYADWHPRESKRGGAWMNPLSTGNRDTKAPRTPHIGVICGNLTPSVGEKTACLTHQEVETVFHEFGHLLHHLCGEVEVKSLNGTHVFWDFVELPSQIMENWCWERESLDLFARHRDTGDPIPAELFEKMTAARNHRKASMTMRQLSFAKLDLELHMRWPGAGDEDLDAFLEERLRDYTPDYEPKPKPNTFQFNHLFADPVGYAAGYYSYKWAEVLEADAFARFQQEGILNPETGADFRAKILARGNVDDPGRLFRDFMGRDPDPDALLRRDGLLETSRG